ncbi:MAG: FlgD immunoglobulin-like domain containing protein [bacterium]
MMCARTASPVDPDRSACRAGFRSTSASSLALALCCVGVLVSASAQHAAAGAWVTGITMTRTPVGSDYDVTVTVSVRTGTNPPGYPGGTVVTCMHVQEEDICFDEDIFDGPVTITVAAAGGTATTTLGPFRYPCSWGNDIGVEVESLTGFKGRSESSSLPRSSGMIDADECGPSIPVGDLTLTSEVFSNPNLWNFMTADEPNPVVPVARGVEGDTGIPIIGFTTRALRDPREIGYDFYELSVSTMVPEFATREVRAAGPNVWPGPEPTEFSRYGVPVSLVPIHAYDAPLDDVRLAEIFLVDAERQLPRVRVFGGDVGSAVDVVHPDAGARSPTSPLGSAPNPFRSETAIRFHLEQPGSARVRVFDGSGRLVRDIPVHASASGVQNVFWDGRDGAGVVQSSGVYFYDVATARWRGRGRMTMLR